MTEPLGANNAGGLERCTADVTPATGGEGVQLHAGLLLGLTLPVDFSTRLGEGSGAVLAVPVVGSAVVALTGIAKLSGLMWAPSPGETPNHGNLRTSP